MGIIFWILLLVLLIMQPFALRTASSGQPKKKRKNGRSLSEIPSQEYTNRLNKRFDQADALEEDEQRSSSRNSEELLIKRSNGNNPMKLKTRETSSTSGNFTSFIFDREQRSERGPRSVLVVLVVVLVETLRIKTVKGLKFSLMFTNVH